MKRPPTRLLTCVLGCPGSIGEGTGEAAGNGGRGVVSEIAGADRGKGGKGTVRVLCGLEGPARV